MKKEISDLGKYGLKDYLSKKTNKINESTVQDMFCDATVVSYPLDNLTLVATTLMLEGINFDLTYFPLKHLAYKSVISALSKIYAMNGEPRQIILNLGISKRFSLEAVEEFYNGFTTACEVYNVDVSGLDISSSVTGMSISVTALGEVEKRRLVTRENAHDTDLLCVSGDLGSAYMGLQLLEREKHIFQNNQMSKNDEAQEQSQQNFNPDFMGKEYILERQLKPEARKDIIKILKEHDIIPNAMVAVDDGLATSLIHLCQASGVGCKVYEDKLPIDYQTAIMAEEFNMNLTSVAMNGGDDFELLFTVPLSKYQDIKDISAIHVIGHITQSKFGMLFETRDGAELPIIAQGWTQEAINNANNKNKGNGNLKEA